MQTIYKYPLKFPTASAGKLLCVAMPEDAVITHVAYQDGVLCCWALVDRDAARSRIQADMRGTPPPPPPPPLSNHQKFTYSLTGGAVHPDVKRIWTVTPDNYQTVYHVGWCGAGQ